MARVTCPGCKTERIVMPERPKKCPKCGMKLTSDMKGPVMKEVSLKPRAYDIKARAKKKEAEKESTDGGGTTKEGD